MTQESVISPLRMAVLLSGRGTTLRNLLDKIDAGQLDAQIALVISSNPAAGGLEIAQSAGIPTLIVERRTFESREAYSRAVFDHCRKASPDLVAMAGFLKRLSIPEDFKNRVMNIHPALLPSFGGRGFYGQRVHAAVLASGAKASGCTVHFVDDLYDHGPIILQETVPVHSDDSAESLAARVFEKECEAYPEALRRFARGSLRVEENRVLPVDHD